jgi:hypothetical protein
MCSVLALLCARGLSQKPLYITGNYAGFTYVLLPKACKICEIERTFTIQASEVLKF